MRQVDGRQGRARRNPRHRNVEVADRQPDRQVQPHEESHRVPALHLLGVVEFQLDIHGQLTGGGGLGVGIGAVPAGLEGAAAGAPVPIEIIAVVALEHIQFAVPTDLPTGVVGIKIEPRDTRACLTGVTVEHIRGLAGQYIGDVARQAVGEQRRAQSTPQKRVDVVVGRTGEVGADARFEIQRVLAGGALVGARACALLAGAVAVVAHFVHVQVEARGAAPAGV